MERYPAGKWDTACGGHVDYGESVDDALRREVSEDWA
jgi:8-oxo-dGTP pyrophosphatase MutT (NUDIX family)